MFFLSLVRRATKRGKALIPFEISLPGPKRAYNSPMAKDKITAASASRLTAVLLALAAWFIVLPLIARPFSKKPQPANPSDRIILERAAGAWGLERREATFGVAVADFDNDGHDDLIISNHNKPPSLFLYRDGAFVDRSDLLPNRVLSDWHGMAAVDLDNDGDKDIVIAGGGADGVGPGEINRLFRNMLVETGHLGFANATHKTGIAYRPWRTRQFLPLPSPDGSHVDLYMVGLDRPNCPNLYFSNTSTAKDIILTPDPGMRLNQILGSEGLDLFLDATRTGRQDLIVIKQFRPVYFERRADGYYPKPGMLPDLGGVYQIAAGDLNNDGYPDLFVSACPPLVHSDSISWDSHEIQFVIEKQKEDRFDEFGFDAPGPSIEVDFNQHTPGNPITGAGDIFVGARGTHPALRRFILKAEDAEGAPDASRPGTYVWRDAANGRWHVRWTYGQNPGPYKGRILADGLADVKTTDFETIPPAEAEDVILINQQGRGFKKLEGLDLRHRERTRSTAMVDLNNDGWLDVIGVRGTEQGLPNGTPFVLINRGGLKFELEPVMANDDDKLFQADQLVWGFFNDDGLPDIFFTNGNGLNPGNLGPYELYLNRTPTDNDYLVLKLQGTKANRDAIGAEVELYSPAGKLLGYRQVGMGFNRDQSTIKVHFGLGKAAPEKLKVRIRWPGSSAWDEREVEKNKVTEIVQ